MPEVIVDEGALEQLPALLSKKTPDSIFLVTGKNSFSSPYLQRILNPLLSRYPHTHFVPKEANPSLKEIQFGIDTLIKKNHSLTIAIGGGRVVDTAKLIHFFSHQELKPEDFLQNRPKNFEAKDSPPFWAIPTTAGTGSESTQFATVYINKIKYSLDHPIVRPSLSLIDPLTMENLPPGPTGEGGMDALTQSIESHWSVRSTNDSRQLSLQALPLLWENIENAVNSPTSEARAAMAKGANLAGQAINITRTTAAHAVSYPMTAHFNIAHGQAVSLSLPEFFEFNSKATQEDLLDPRGLSHLQARLSEILEALRVSSIDQFKKDWIELMRRIGLKTSLFELGVEAKHHALIISEGFNPDRVKNNPRRVEEKSLLDLLRKI